MDASQKIVLKTIRMKRENYSLYALWVGDAPSRVSDNLFTDF